MGDGLALRRSVSIGGTLFLGLMSWASPVSVLAQSWSTMRASRENGGETELNVLVRYGMGRFTISAGDPSRLYEMLLRYDEDSFEPVHEFENSRLTVGVDGSGSQSLFRRGSSEGELDLRLSSQVPMDLELEFGAVQADLDLGGLRLRSLDLSTGASEAELRVSAPNPEVMRFVRFAIGAASLRARELGRLNAEEVTLEAGVGDVRLDFSGLQREETRIRAEIGLGNLEIRIPSEAGIRLTRESFLTSLEAPELERRGEAFFSSNWDSSSMRVMIEVEAAFGRVSILRTE